MDIPHEPVKYANVAVHTDINIVHTLWVTQILLKVAHIGDKQILFAFKVFVHFLVFVAHMDDDLHSTVD